MPSIEENEGRVQYTVLTLSGQITGLIKVAIFLHYMLIDCLSTANIRTTLIQKHIPYQKSKRKITKLFRAPIKILQIQQALMELEIAEVLEANQ